jgi:hypothetical protein
MCAELAVPLDPPASRGTVRIKTILPSTSEGSLSGAAAAAAAAVPLPPLTCEVVLGT